MCPVLTAGPTFAQFPVMRKTSSDKTQPSRDGGRTDLSRLSARADCAEWRRRPLTPDTWAEILERLKTNKFDSETNDSLTSCKRLFVAVYMSYMSQNFCSFHASNLSVIDFRICRLMYPGRWLMPSIHRRLANWPDVRSGRFNSARPDRLGQSPLPSTCTDTPPTFTSRLHRSETESGERHATRAEACLTRALMRSGELRVLMRGWPKGPPPPLHIFKSKSRRVKIQTALERSRRSLQDTIMLTLFFDLWRHRKVKNGQKRSKCTDLR